MLKINNAWINVHPNTILDGQSFLNLLSNTFIQRWAVLAA